MDARLGGRRLEASLMTAATAARHGLIAGLTALVVALMAAMAHAGDTIQMPAASDGPVMLGARIVGDSQRVRFVADLSKKVAATVFTLADPDRIVVDLPEVRFALPALAGSTGRGLISAFRYGLISPGKSRIVMDLTGPTLIDKTFIVDPADGQPARLVIDAVPTTRAKFLAATRAYKEQQLASAAEAPDAGVAATPGDHGDKPIIVVDPGHGGIDTGAHGGGGVLEKDVTLAFGKTLGKLLEATGRYRVIYTRDDDSYISLGERVTIARNNNADLFVSIHANSFPGGSVRGAIVYTASDKASDQMAASLANTENESDALAGVDINAGEFERREGHSGRPDAPRNPQFRRDLRPQSDQGTRQDDADVQGSPPGSRIQGAGGAGRALGAGRTRLSDQPQRRQADGHRGLAGQDRRLDGQGDRRLFPHAGGRPQRQLRQWPKRHR